MIICNVCNSAFKRIYDLRKHVKKYHKDANIDDIAPLGKYSAEKTYKFNCDVCKKNFNHKNNLTYHKKRNHGMINDSNKRKALKCPLCEFEASPKTQMYSHFVETHDFEICFERIAFSRKEEFERWKVSMEQCTNSLFVKIKGDFQYKSKTIISYTCHRSGFYIPGGENKRKLKAQGSRKIGGFCPAGIKVIVNPDGQHEVTYISTHVGHTPDLGHLNLTTEERKIIADKLASKTPYSKILDEAHYRISEGSTHRINLLTRKDLNNIAAAVSLQEEVARHPIEVINVDGLPALKNEDCGLIEEDEGEETNTDQHIHINYGMIDYGKVIERVTTRYSPDPVDENLQHQKDELKRWFSSVVDSVLSISQLNIIKDIVAPLEPAVKEKTFSGSLGTKY
ncbi:hypothetical protein JTB14_010770 [Gonioctena quinquepunctata]|nr:hypothetical protein JTB14_010770 [Gonioctena quinquepunctata]